MSQDKERAENKVRKLMALANDHGASEQEAATALRQAEALIQKHQIQLAELMATTKAAPTFDWANQFVPYGRYGKTTWEAKTVPMWYNHVAVGVGRFTDTLVKLHCRPVVGAGMGFYGEAQDVEMAVWLMGYLQDTVFWLAHAQKDLDRGGKEAFRKGMAGRLQKRMYNLRAERNQELKATGTALVVVNTKLHQRDQEFGPQHTKATKLAVKSANGYQRGNAAGNEVSLNRPLSGGQQARLS